MDGKCTGCGHDKDDHGMGGCCSQYCTRCGELIATHPNLGSEGYHEIWTCECTLTYSEGGG